MKDFIKIIIFDEEIAKYNFAAIVLGAMFWGFIIVATLFLSIYFLIK
jgi:hypothetical protein